MGSLSRSLFLSCVVLWVFMFDIIVCCDGASPKYGNMTKDQDLEVGSTLIIKCTLFTHLIPDNHTQYYVTSENLVIKFESTFLENLEVLDSLSIQYRVENATINDTGMYNCFLAIPQLNYTPFVCTTYVAVGYKPLPVENFSCVSLHYRNLTCSWTKPFNPVKTKYELWDYLHLIAMRRKCPVSTDSSCQWRVDTAPPYRKSSKTLYFLLEGRNSLGNYTQYINIDHFKIVKPAQPKKVMFTNVTKNSLRVQWLPPKGMEYGDFPPGLQYWLYYCPPIDQPETCREVNTRTETSFLIKDLVPYTEYRFSLRCRSNVADNEAMWSPFLNSSIGTEPDIPYLAPETDSSSFLVQNIQGNRSITLYWKPVPLQYENGEGFQYIIQYHLHYVSHRPKREYHETEVGNHTTYTFKHLDLSSAYLFRIYAKNNVGIATNSSIIVVDKTNNLLQGPKDIAVLSHGKGRYTVSWKPPEESDKSAKNYTLFWCQNIKPRPFKCEGPLQWINTQDTYQELELFDKDTNYQFAVASNVNYLTSGLKWASCVVPYSGVLYKVKDVMLTPKNSTSIRVRWTLDCNAQKSVVQEYSISYCQVHSDHSCSGHFNTVHLKTPIKEEYIVGSLHPYTLYKVVVLARTADGWSEDSDIKFESTMPAAPSDPPQNVKVVDVNDTTIHVSFQSPNFPNGEITRYSIFYDKALSSNNVKHRIDFPVEKSGVYEAEIKNGIFFYTNYSIEVEACVDLACSPRSRPVYVLTGIGKPGKMDPPHTEIINSTLVNITWKPPDMPNGPIDMYIITLAWEVVEFELTEIKKELYNVTGSEHFLPVFVNCPIQLSDVRYFFSIQSVNVKNGTFLYSTHSEPAQTRLCLVDSAGPSYKLILGLSAGIAVGMAIFVAGIYALAKWMKKEVDLIKGITVQLPTGLDSPIENPLSSYDKFKNGLQKNRDAGIPSERVYERLCSFASDKAVKDLENACNISDEELAHKKVGREKTGRNHSGESNVSCKGHDSICSSNTNKTHLSIDSGAEMDLPPSPDGMFSDTSSSNTTPRSYKPDLAIVEERNSSGSKDSGLEKEGLGRLSPILSGKNDADLSSKFAWYVKNKSHPYANVQLQKNVGQIRPYSKFAVIAPAVVPTYVPIGVQNLSLLDHHSLANSEPSVAEFEGGNDCEPLVFSGVPPYCRFGLARSAGNGLNMTGHAFPVHQNFGYSKFGIIYRALRKPDEDNHINNGSAFASLDPKLQFPKIIQNKCAVLKTLSALPEDQHPYSPYQMVRPTHIDIGPKSNVINPALSVASSEKSSNIPGEIPHEIKSVPKFAAESTVPKPLHNGYVSFHDLLNNPSEKEKVSSVDELQNLAYSKFCLNQSPEENFDPDNSNKSNADLSTGNFSRALEPLGIENNIDNNSSYSNCRQPATQQAGSNSYISFQDAKALQDQSDTDNSNLLKENSSTPASCLSSSNTVNKNVADSDILSDSNGQPSESKSCASPTNTDADNQNCKSESDETDAWFGKSNDYSKLNVEIPILADCASNYPSEQIVSCAEAIDAIQCRTEACNETANPSPDGLSETQTFPHRDTDTCSRAVNRDTEKDRFDKCKSVSNGYVTWSELTAADLAKPANTIKVTTLPRTSPMTILSAENV